MRMAIATASPRRSESSKLPETLLDINDMAPTTKLNARIAGRILGRLAGRVDGPVVQQVGSFDRRDKGVLSDLVVAINIQAQWHGE